MMRMEISNSVTNRDVWDIAVEHPIVVRGQANSGLPI